MKGYLMSILIIGIALGGVGLGTFAYWSDEWGVDSHRFETGTFAVEGNIFDTSGEEKETLSVSNLFPSAVYEDVGFIVVKNYGSAAQKFKLHLELDEYDPDGLQDLIYLKITRTPTWIPSYDVTKWSQYGTTAVVFEDKISALVETAPITINGPFKQNEFVVYKVEARLIETADNYFMDGFVVADLKVKATQYNNPE